MSAKTLLYEIAAQLEGKYPGLTEDLSTRIKDLHMPDHDIRLFFSAGSGRGSNDSSNKMRESILCMLYNPPAEYLSDPEWVSMQTKWREFLSTLCAEPYDDVSVTQRGGRGENYDFDIAYLRAGSPVKTIKAEFKHNASSISSLPQYFSPAENKRYIPTSYAEFYHAGALDQICALYGGIEKPDREAYLRMVYSDNYKKHALFQTLYDADNSKDHPQKRERSRIVKQSIAAYLDTNRDKLNLALLSEDIRERQQGKVFILWDLKTFRADTIRDDEMEIVSVGGVKNGNVLVAVSKAGTRHNMLLRWKNHLGVLYPAWQISLTR